MNVTKHRQNKKFVEEPSEKYIYVRYFNSACVLEIVPTTKEGNKI